MLYFILVLLALAGFVNSFPTFAYTSEKARRHGELFRFNIEPGICNNLPDKATCPVHTVACSNAHIFGTMTLNEVTEYLKCDKFGSSFILDENNKREYFEGPNCMIPAKGHKPYVESEFFPLSICNSNVAYTDVSGKFEVVSRASLLFPAPPEPPSGPTASSSSILESVF